MKKVIVIISIILIMLGIGFGGYLFIKDFSEDQKRTLAIMEKIKSEYQEFSPIVEKFSESRTDFYTAKEELFFLESIEDNKEEINTMMTDYHTLVMEAHNSSTYLKENCFRKYANNSVNNTCNLFKQGYEAIMNYYITDIEVYNTIVTEHINWIEENSFNLEPLQPIEFTLYENYIDYDADGSFLGGE